MSEERAGDGSRLAVNSSLLVVQPLAMNVLSIASTGYITRTIGPEGFAQFSIGLAFATMFAPLTNMGLRALTVRRVAAVRTDTAEHLGLVLALRTSLALVTVLVVVLAAPLSSASTVTQSVVIVSSLTLLVNTVVGVLTDGFHGHEDMRAPAAAATWGGVVLTLLSVVAVALGGTPTHLAATYVVGPVITCLMLWLSARRLGIAPRWRWNLHEFKGLLRESMPFFGQGALESVASRLDLLFLTRTLGEASLGGYTAASQLVSRFAVVVDGAATALLPALARQRATDPQRVPQTMRGVLQWLLLLTVPAAVAVGLAAPTIMRAIYGSAYRDGAWPLTLGIAALPLTATAVVLGHGLFAASRNRVVITSSATATITTTASILPAAYLGGLVGAPLARLLGRGLLVALRLRAARDEYRGIWGRSNSITLLLAVLPVAASFGAARLVGAGIPGFTAAALPATLGWVAVVWWRDCIPTPMLARVGLRPRSTA